MLLNRRTVLAAAGTLAAPRAFAAPRELPEPKFRIVATGLKFPEGPVALADGSVLVCEIERRSLSRVAPTGKVEVVANLGGGPNGAALGPDGACYVCNNGGLSFPSYGKNPPMDSGSVQRVDLTTGTFSTLLETVNGNALIRPNDLVFDGAGGFWFTDAGKDNPRNRSFAGVYWARTDGTDAREVIYPLVSANGIALSPDGATLYVAAQGRLLAYGVTAPGVIEHETSWVAFGRKYEGARPRVRVIGAPTGDDSYDSLRVEAGGDIVVATLGRGGLTTWTPAGGAGVFTPLPDVMVTNLAFGGPDMKTAFVCFSARGELAAVDWPRPGLKLRHSA